MMAAYLKAVTFNGCISGIQISTLNDNTCVFSSHPQLLYGREQGNSTTVCHSNVNKEIKSHQCVLIYLTLNNNVVYAFVFQEEYDGFMEITIPTNAIFNSKITTLQVHIVCFDQTLKQITTPIVTNNNFIQLALTSPKQINNLDQFRGKFMYLLNPYFWESDGNCRNISWLEREILKCYDKEQHVLNDINKLFVFAMLNLNDCSLEDFDDIHVAAYFHNFNLTKWIQTMNDELQNSQSSLTLVDLRQSVVDPDLVPRLLVNDAHYFLIRDGLEVIKSGILLPSSHFTLTLHELISSK